MNQPAHSVADRNKALLESSESFVYKPLEPLDAGEDLSVHLFYPAAAAVDTGPRPAVLFFFSSQWDSGQIAQFAPHALYFASRGAVSMVFEYRTKSTHETGPVKTMADIRTAIRWARYNHEHLDIDPSKVIAIGATAAAHGIATAAMVDGFEDNAGEALLSCVPDAMVLFSPIVDLSKKGYGFERFADINEAKRYDPTRFIRKSLPPMLIFQGSSDRVVPSASVAKFAKRMKRKKNVCEIEIFQGKGHGFFNFNVDVVSYEATISGADRFLVEQGFFDPSEDDDGSMRLVSWREQEY